jgi:hypothetical protein
MTAWQLFKEAWKAWYVTFSERKQQPPLPPWPPATLEISNAKTPQFSIFLIPSRGSRTGCKIEGRREGAR